MSLLASDFGLSYGLEWVGLAILVWFVVWKFPGPLLNQAMDRRAAQIRETLEGAAAARAEAERQLAEARADLERSKQDAEGIVEQATRSAAQIEAEGRREAELEAGRIVARAEVESGLERARLLEQVGGEVSEVVLRATDAVVRRELEAAALQRQLLEAALSAAEAEAV